jgi:hypothetical protein
VRVPAYCRSHALTLAHNSLSLCQLLLHDLRLLAVHALSPRCMVAVPKHTEDQLAGRGTTCLAKGDACATEACATEPVHEGLITQLDMSIHCPPATGMLGDLLSTYSGKGGPGTGANSTWHGQ